MAPRRPYESRTGMRQKLTKRAVDALRATGQRVEVFDTDLPGFSVRVTAGGVKTFYAHYRAGPGRAAPKRRYTIGRFGPLTVDEARDEARQVLARAARGEDPARDRDSVKAARAVTELGAEWLDDVDARRKPRTAGSYRYLWRTCIEPAIGNLRARDVSVEHISAMHRRLRDTPVKANRALAVCGSFFSHLERLKLRPRHANPAHEVDAYPEHSRERFLAPAEFARLLSALDRAERVGLPPAPQKRRRRATERTRKHIPKSVGKLTPANPWAVAAIRFLAFSGWRESEALRLRWSEVDRERGVALLPDTKTGRSARPLGAAALALLDALPRIGDHVFPGRKPKSHLKEIGRVWMAVRHGAGIEDVRLHDLRHSFASVIASSGGSLLMIGKLLGHRDTATTAKYAHLLADPVRDVADAAGARITEWAKGKAEG